MPLDPCPNPDCGSATEMDSEGEYVICPKCAMYGPGDDPKGDKWNATCRAIAAKQPAEVSCTPDNTRVGAVVRLKSNGSPEMVVFETDGIRGVKVQLVTEYYAAGFDFPLACLSLVRPAPEVQP